MPDTLLDWYRKGEGDVLNCIILKLKDVGKIWAKFDNFFQVVKSRFILGKI